MHYYVDGYNLLFRLVRSEEEFHQKRQQIISDLSLKIEKLHLDITIVFDAPYQMGEMTRSHLGKLEVIFTAHRQTADEFILEAVKNSLHPLAETVVTSDKKLAWFARRSSAKTESVEQFLQWLNQRYKNSLSRAKKAKKEAFFKSIQLAQNSQNCQKSVVEAETSCNPIQNNAVVVLKPGAQAQAEECFDYYLQSFEEEHSKIQRSEEENQTIAKQKIKFQKKAKNEERRSEGNSVDEMYEFDRWLRLFQEAKKEKQD